MATLLVPANGNDYVNAGESAVVTATLYDTSGATLDKAAVSTLTATLTDPNGNVINLRNAQSIRDANNGTLASDGTVTLKLQPADTKFYTSEPTTEKHYLQLAWTWTDGDSDSLTGKHDYYFVCGRLPTSQSNTDSETKYITRGDSYDGTANPTLTWSVNKDFDGWTGTMTIRHRTTGASLMSVSVSRTDASTIEASLTTTNTAFSELASDDEFGPHPYDVQMVSGSNERTAVSGIAIIRKDRTTA